MEELSTIWQQNELLLYGEPRGLRGTVLLLWWLKWIFKTNWDFHLTGETVRKCSNCELRELCPVALAHINDVRICAEKTRGRRSQWIRLLLEYFTDCEIWSLRNFAAF